MQNAVQGILRPIDIIIPFVIAVYVQYFRSNTVSLNVLIHKAGTRTYTDSYELLLEDGHTILHDEVARALQLPLEDFIIARKLVDKHTWQVLHREDSAVSTVNGLYVIYIIILYENQH